MKNAGDFLLTAGPKCIFLQFRNTKYLGITTHNIRAQGV